MPYYHVTPTINVTRILKEGLIPQIGPRSALMEREDGIYLFNSVEDAETALGSWLGDAFDDEFADDEEPMALLEVELPPDAKLVPTPAEYETVVTTPIPPQFIKVINRNF